MFRIKIKGLIFFISLIVLSVNDTKSQNLPSDISEFSKFLHGGVEQLTIPRDTLSFINSVLKAYKNENRLCGFFDKRTPNHHSEGNPNTAGAVISHNYRSDFVVLCIIEFEIIRKDKEALSHIPVIRDKKSGNEIHGFFFADKDALDMFTGERLKKIEDKETKELRKIFRLYLKWIKKAKKIGYCKILEQSIHALDGTKYEWKVVR